MAPGVFNIGELRYKNRTTTFSTAFINGDTTPWDAGNHTRVGAIAVPDLSGLTDSGLPDTTLVTRLHRRPANIQALQDGLGFSFSTYLEGGPASGTVVPNNVADLLAQAMCKQSNIISPTATQVDTPEAGTTTASIKATAHTGVVGQAALLGVRGDLLGNGEVRIIKALSDADHFEVDMLTNGAMTTTADGIVFAQTVYLSPTATDFDYSDWLYIGHDTTSPDQYQTLGGVLTFELTGLAPGELPTVNFTIQNGSWRNHPTSNKPTIVTTDPAWNSPAGGELALGGLFLADSGTGVARNTYQVANVSINPGVTFVPIPDPSGTNGIGGFIKVPSTPTVEFDALYGDSDAMPGLLDDYEAQTSKMATFQFGSTIGRTCAVDFQNLYIDAAPTRIDVNGLAGVHVVAHGDALATPTGTDVRDAAMRIHFM
ncbi:MAG: hypothetical protein V3W44_09585 [Dehalococcoidales bacterium]